MTDAFTDSLGHRRSHGSLTGALCRQLMAVEPSRDPPLEYRPCRAFLKDGSVFDRVIFTQAEAYVRIWGVWPEDDRWKRFLIIKDVVRIEESPLRLPVSIANRLYAGGETSMGGIAFVLVLSSGECLQYSMGNMIDFPEFPAGVRPDMVVDVAVPGKTSFAGEVYRNSDYRWCLYAKCEGG